MYSVGYGIYRCDVTELDVSKFEFLRMRMVICVGAFCWEVYVLLCKQTLLAFRWGSLYFTFQANLVSASNRKQPKMDVTKLPKQSRGRYGDGRVSTTVFCLCQKQKVTVDPVHTVTRRLQWNPMFTCCP